MKILITIILLISPLLSFAQNDSVPQYTNNLRAVNLLRTLADEIRLSYSPDKNDRYGAYVGYIHPNVLVRGIFNDVNTNAEIFFSKKGFLLGAYLRPIKKAPIYINYIHRSFTANLESYLEIERGSSFYGTDTEIDRTEVSDVLYVDLRETFGNGRIKHEVYAGFGAKVKTITTEYDLGQSRDELTERKKDNGTYRSMTIHIGYSLLFQF